MLNPDAHEARALARALTKRAGEGPDDGTPGDKESPRELTKEERKKLRALVQKLLRLAFESPSEAEAQSALRQARGRAGDFRLDDVLGGSAPAAGGRDGGPGELLPPPTRPLAVARVLAEERMAEGKLTLRQWSGTWHEYDGTGWSAAEDEVIRGWVYRRTEDAVYVNEKKLTLESWSPTRARVNGVLHALGEAIALIPAATELPAWLGDDDHPEKASEVIATSAGLLHVASGKLLPADPDYFSLVSVGYGYDPAAPEPERWLRMMAEMWPMPGEADNIRCLQEWMGYVLSGRTDQQKIGVIIGPRRSGKGTVGRVLTALIGPDLVAAPMLKLLNSQFGMQSMIGKTLAIISDAKLKAGDAFDPGRLLETSGEDRQTTDVKYRPHWTGVFRVRFMLLANQFPSFRDNATAVVGRCVVMQTKATFSGREDDMLTDYLVANELPGILNWCLKGLERLNEQGRFTEPRAGAGIIAAMEEAAQPVKLFADEMCDLRDRRAGKVNVIGKQELFDAWSEWCQRTGHKRGDISAFGADLPAQVPGVQNYRPREKGRSRDAPRPYLWRGISLRAGSAGSTAPAGSGAAAAAKRAQVTKPGKTAGPADPLDPTRGEGNGPRNNG